MRNNFELIEPLLDFTLPNTFYFIQVLKRRKENPDMKSNTSVIDNFYLYGPNDLAKLMPKIIEQCEKHNARAYINVNRLDLEKVALFTQKAIIDCIINKDFKGAKGAYASVCSTHFSEKNKRWVIDIINKLHADIPKRDYKILAEIPTATGVHLITEPFEPSKFSHVMMVRNLSKIERKDNSPTLLYIGESI